MFTIIQQVVTGLMSGLVEPLFQWLNKKQDTQLAGFQTAAGIDGSAYAAWLQFQLGITQAKAAANAWWGAKTLYLVVGGAAAVHTAAIFLDSTFRFGWAVPALPSAYADYEHVIIYSLFVVSTIGPPMSAATAWLHRK